MNNKESVWTFRRRMVLLLGSGVIVFLVYLVVRYLFVLASPFIIAYGIALVIEKPVNALAKVFRGKKHWHRLDCNRADHDHCGGGFLYYMAGCGRN